MSPTLEFQRFYFYSKAEDVKHKENVLFGSKGAFCPKGPFCRGEPSQHQHTLGDSQCCAGAGTPPPRHHRPHCWPGRRRGDRAAHGSEGTSAAAPSRGREAGEGGVSPHGTPLPCSLCCPDRHPACRARLAHLAATWTGV